MLRRTLTVVVCVLAVSLSALGETMVVKLKDGRTIRGKVEKTARGKQYKITQFVGPRKVPMAITVAVGDVLSMTPVSTPEDEYHERLKDIPPNDADARFKLGEWAFGKGMLKIAQHELEVALKLKPNHEGALLLLKQVKARIASGTGGTNGGRTNGGTTTIPLTADRKLMISERDLNRIRLGELANGKWVRKNFLGRLIWYQGKESARVAFDKKVMSRFVDYMRSDEDFRVNPTAAGDAFKRWKQEDQFAYMLDRLDRSDWAMKDDLIVKTDPASMKTFHRTIWPMLAKSCGSTQCHGAEKGQGQLKLFSIKGNDSVGLYSNFMILEMYAKGGRMIERDHPEESKLLEAALPRKEAKWKHPAKAKATPLFTGVTDTRYKTVVKWIESLKGPPRPYYGVTYRPPFGPAPGAGGMLKPRKAAGRQ